MKMKAVIFDIDGTLVDSVDLHAKAWQDAFAHFKVNLSFEAIRSQIGKGGDHLVPFFLSDEQNREFGEELQTWRGEHFKKNYMSSVRAFHDSHRLLENVKKRGKLLAAGSSAKQDELDHYLGLLKAEQLFDITTSADDVDRSKPSPDIFEIALSKLNTQANDTVVVGDSPYDAEAALKIGLATIGVLSGGFPEEWLRSAGAIKIYKNPTDLLEKLHGSPICSKVAKAKTP